MKYHFSAEELDHGCREEGSNYFEFLRHPALNAGIYMLPANAYDPQEPHTEDEIYFVLAGAARITIANREYPARKGDLLYVPAFIEHRFHDITEDLRLLVFFSGAAVEKPGS